MVAHIQPNAVDPDLFAIRVRMLTYDIRLESSYAPRVARCGIEMCQSTKAPITIEIRFELNNIRILVVEVNTSNLMTLVRCVELCCGIVIDKHWHYYCARRTYQFHICIIIYIAALPLGIHSADSIIPIEHAMSVGSIWNIAETQTSKQVHNFNRFIVIEQRSVE